MPALQRCRTSACALSGLWLAFCVPLARAEVTFHLQREGAPDDGGLEQFQAAAAPLAVADYEDPLLGGPGATVGGLFIDPETFVAVRGTWGGDYFDPLIASSPEFNAPDRFFNNAIVAGVALRVEAPADKPLHAVGMWIFDDGREADSAYLVTVTEADGAVWTAVLENDIPLNAKFHEIEGFVGAISTVGISQVDVLAVDPLTLAPHFDFFEVDFVMAALMPPPSEPPYEEDPPADDSADPVPPADDDSNGTRCDRDRHRPSQPRGCHRGRPHAPKGFRPPQSCDKPPSKPSPSMRRGCNRR